MNFEELLNDAKVDSNGVTRVDPLDERRAQEVMRQIDWRNDAKARKAIADILVRRMREEIRVEDISQFYADREMFNIGDTPQFAFQKGIKAFVHEPGTVAPRSTLNQRIITVEQDLISAHPEFEISQLEGGRFNTIASVRVHAEREIIGKRNSILWNTLRASISSGDANYAQCTTVMSDAIKKNFLVSGINYVDDVAPAGIRAIVGRRSQLGFIMELSGYSEVFKEKVDRGGDSIQGGVMLGEFRGIPIVALHQYTDGWDVNVVDPDSIMIVANDTTKLAFTEELSALEALEVDDRMWHMHLSERWGAAVLWADRNWRLVFTDL